MMFKGIRAQLFFGFGGLVLVISLFYSRLTFLFVDVTQDMVGAFVVSHVINTHEETLPAAERLAAFTTQAVTYVNDTELSALGELEPSVHDETLFRISIEQTSGYATQLSGTEGPLWLLVNVNETAPLSVFSSVFAVFLGSIAVAVLVLSVLSTWFIAAKLSQPIRNLTQAVSQQQREEACDIKETSRNDEIGQLATAFEHTYGELQHAWRREHDFASDVSHELRTPVALIRNTLELNTSNTLKPEDRQLLEQSTATLQSTIEVLLALARKENLVFESIYLLPILERVALAIHHMHPEQPFEVDFDLPSDIRVHGNPNLTSLLCQNLINNSFYHGNGRKMRVYQQRDMIVFENMLCAEKSKIYQGLGHGQYLVTRMANVMGWGITVEYDQQHYRVMVSSFD